MGLRRVALVDRHQVRWHVYDFRVRHAERGSIDVATDGPRICEATIALWQGLADVDGLNRLVTFAAMPWDDVDLLRAYRHYRRQVDTRYGETSITDALVEHTDLARGLVDAVPVPARSGTAAGDERGRPPRSVERALRPRGPTRPRSDPARA